MRAKRRFWSPTGYVPKVYGYGRVSHKAQFDKGNSIADQEVRIKQYFEMKKADPEGPFGRCEWGGMISEPRAQSAYSREFGRRPAGAEILKKLQPDDHIIVDKLDRIFRDLGDFITQTRYFTEHGIGMHLVNYMGLSFDSHSTGGDLLLKIMVMFAEMECEIRGERVRLARQRLRESGRHQGVPPPFWCNIEGEYDGKKIGGSKRLVFKHWVPELMADVLAGKKINDKLADVCGSTSAASVSKNASKFRDFTKAWIAAGKPDINTLNTNDFIQEWKQAKEQAEREE